MKYYLFKMKNMTNWCDLVKKKPTILFKYNWIGYEIGNLSGYVFLGIIWGDFRRV